MRSDPVPLEGSPPAPGVPRVRTPLPVTVTAAAAAYSAPVSVTCPPPETVTGAVEPRLK